MASNYEMMMESIAGKLTHRNNRVYIEDDNPTQGLMVDRSNLNHEPEEDVYPNTTDSSEVEDDESPSDNSDEE